MIDILAYNGYYATLHYNAEDEVFYGKAFGIDDLISFEGTSVKELKKNFQEAIDDYLETCKELGKEPNKTYKGTFNVRITTDLHKEAALYASKNNITLNDFIKKAIQYALQNQEDMQRKDAMLG